MHTVEPHWPLGDKFSFFDERWKADTFRLGYSAARGFKLSSRSQGGKAKGNEHVVVLHQRHRGLRVPGLDDFERVK